MRATETSSAGGKGGKYRGRQIGFWLMRRYQSYAYLLDKCRHAWMCVRVHTRLIEMSRVNSAWWRHGTGSRDQWGGGGWPRNQSEQIKKWHASFRDGPRDLFCHVVSTVPAARVIILLLAVALTTDVNYYAADWVSNRKNNGVKSQTSLFHLHSSSSQMRSGLKKPDLDWSNGCTSIVRCNFLN